MSCREALEDRSVCDKGSEELAGMSLVQSCKISHITVLVWLERKLFTVGGVTGCYVWVPWALPVLEDTEEPRGAAQARRGRCFEEHGEFCLSGAAGFQGLSRGECPQLLLRETQHWHKGRGVDGERARGFGECGQSEPEGKDGLLLCEL